MVDMATRRYRSQAIGEPVMAAAIDREFRRVDDALVAYPESKGILQGLPPPMAVGVTKAIITGYPTEYEGTGFEGRVDPVLGVIALPADGLYQIAAHVAGTHSNSTQNEALLAFLRSTNNGDLDIAGWPIATNKISGAIMNGTLTAPFVAGDVLSLGLYATTSIGTFTFTSASFEVTLRTLG